MPSQTYFGSINLLVSIAIDMNRVDLDVRRCQVLAGPLLILLGMVRDNLQSTPFLFVNPLSF